MRALRRLPLFLLPVAAAISCGREITGPQGGGRMGRLPALAMELPANARAADGTNLVAFDRVHVRITRANSAVALERTIDFPADADSLPLALPVELASDAPSTGEPMNLLVELLNGTTVMFRAGPLPIVVREGDVADPETAVTVDLTYIGPGATATRVVISPSVRNVSEGDPVTFTAQAFDALDNLILTAPVKFTSTDTSVVFMNEAGTGVARSKRGTARVIAALLNDAADTADVTVALDASMIELVSGNGQTGVAGAPLSQNVVVRARAVDNVPVAGVNVTFAAGSGGAPVSGIVTTDAAGLASATWTLGPTVGGQSLNASASGLAGSPIIFIASAVAGTATQLAVTTQPTSVVAGVAISPSVVVTARTAGGLTATTFSGNVTIALGSNPGSSTLGGTLIVAAVNGVATFSGLTLNKIGTGYTLVATSGVLTQANSAGFSVTPAAATVLAFSVQPGGGTPATTLVPAPRVAARDAFGNLTAYSGSVSIAIGANPGGASLTGTATVTAVAGEATFANLQLSAVGVGYTFVASAGGMSDATSDPFTIGSTVISWINPSGGAWSNTANWNLGRVPNASDVASIILGGTYTVTLDVNTTVAGIDLGGASGAQTLYVPSRTLTVAAAVNVNTRGVLTVTNSTIAGTGTIVNDGAVTIVASTVNPGVDNRTTFVVSGNSTLNGTVTTNLGSVLHVAQVDGSNGTATLNVSNGFTNVGTIELSVDVPQPYNAQLLVPNGVLVNAASGTIRTMAGAQGGGSRSVQGQVDNIGLIDVQVPLTISGSGAAHTNSGTIDVTAANLTLNQSGATPSLTNTGTITIGSGRTFAVTGGALTLAAGTVGGAGALSLSSVTFNLGVPFSNAVTALGLVNTTVNGPATLTNASGRTVTQVASAVNAPFSNQGTLIVSGSSSINGALTTTASSVLRVAQVDGSNGTATLSMANGFTNLGAIELSVAIAQPYNSQLVMPTGTLVNAPGATISSLAGTQGGGSRTITAEVDNQGSIDVQVPLTISGSGADHLNSGTIDVTAANLTLNQSGATPTFTNSGTITIGSGRTFSVSSGALTLASGTLGGSGLLSVTGVTLGLGAAFTNAVTQLTVVNSTINGPGTLTNATGQSLTLVASTVNATLDNQGTLVVSGSSAINGTLTTQAGSLLRVAQVDGSNGTATLTVANGFTNVSQIELSVMIAQPYNSQLIVTNGTLVNASAGVITTLVGTQAGGSRTLGAELDNQGLLDLQVPLTLSKVNADHQNSGTIDLTAADLTLNQSGSTPSFTNTGTITLATGRTWDVSNGALNFASGSIGGAGTVSIAGTTLALGVAFTNAVTALSVTNSTVNGPASLTNAAGQSLTLVASTINAPFDNQGLLIASGSSAITGSFTTTAASTLRVAQVDGSNGTATLTVANGFTNLGVINLTVIVAQPYSAQLIVTNGTLVNAPSGIISAEPGTVAGGSRALNAQLDNQGLLQAQVPLSISHTSADHVNSGIFDINPGSLTINQSGTTPSFTNTGSGTITIGAARTFAVNSGTITSAPGGAINGGTLTISGATAAFDGAAPAVNAVNLISSTVSFATALNSGTVAYTFTNSTVNGAGLFTNAAGQTLTLVASTVNMPVDNLGTLVSSGASALNGTFTTNPGSTVQVGQVDGSNSNATLTVANGFTNVGAIELTVIVGAAYSAHLAVTTGTLVNASGGTISALPGAVAGGSRSLDAELDNQGTLTVLVPLTMNRPGADHLNSGTIDLTAANLTLTQGGATPSFTNSGAGTITIGAGRTFAVTGGTFASGPGATMTGGSVVLSSLSAAFNGAAPAVSNLVLNGTTASFSTALNSGTVAYSFTNSTISGAGLFTNAAGQTLTLVATAMNMALDNQGTLVASGASSLSGAFTTSAGSILRVGQVDGSNSSATLTVASGFTNLGAIELTVIVGAAYNANLVVTSGTLVNASGGTISALPGALAGGARTLDASLDNQGTLTVATPLTLTHTSADHLNSGTIDLSAANLTLNQSGSTPSFTNSGTITIGAGRTFTVNNGALTSDPGATISGGTLAIASATAAFNGAAPAVTALNLVATTASFAAALNTGTVSYGFTNSTINGAGTFTNAAGQTLTLVATTMNLPVDNLGTLVASGASAVNGTFTANAGSMLRIGQVDGSNSSATLTVANGFTNLGAIELTVIFNAGYSAQLVVTNGTLVNAAGGTISALPGTLAGGSRTIDAQLDNQGTVTALTPLTMNRASADHVNSGTINASSANLTLTQSGTTPTFTNTGTITVGAGRTFSVTNGLFTSDPGATITGGTLTVASATAAFNGAAPAVTALNLFATTASFAAPLNTSAVALGLSSATITGASTLTNAAGQTLTLVASTIGMPLDNQGTIVASGFSAIDGALTTSAGSILRVGQVDGSNSTATLTVANGFTNSGAIELTVTFGAAYSANLVVGTGTLTNAAGGTISSLNGTVGGGSRTISAALDNQGTITVGPGTAGRLNVVGSLSTSGTIVLDLGGTTADTQYDRIVVSAGSGGAGSVALGGTLNVGLINAFTPASLNSFGVISATARTGTFATTNLPPGITTPPTYGATGVTLVAP